MTGRRRTSQAGSLAALERARRGRANLPVYWTTRALLRPVFAIWYRLERSGREHIPRSGPLILAANHRSVLDPIVIGLLLRRHVYYMAKQELFRKRWQARYLSALGAFPVDRRGDTSDAIEVAQRILERGDCLVIFPEGKCVPSGALGQPRPGVGRLAQATGAPVVPVAIDGTGPTRTRRLPPPRIRVRVGVPLSFPKIEQQAAPATARLATARIWEAVTREWKALGGTATILESKDASRTISATRRQGVKRNVTTSPSRSS